MELSVSAPMGALAGRTAKAQLDEGIVNETLEATSQIAAGGRPDPSLGATDWQEKLLTDRLGAAQEGDRQFPAAGLDLAGAAGRGFMINKII